MLYSYDDYGEPEAKYLPQCLIMMAAYQFCTSVQAIHLFGIKMSEDGINCHILVNGQRTNIYFDDALQADASGVVTLH